MIWPRLRGLDAVGGEPWCEASILSDDRLPLLRPLRFDWLVVAEAVFKIGRFLCSAVHGMIPSAISQNSVEEVPFFLLYIYSENFTVAKRIVFLSLMVKKLYFAPLKMNRFLTSWHIIVLFIPTLVYLRLFLDIFSKTQLDQNSTNFKTQPTFSSKLRILVAKLIFRQRQN